MLAFTEKGSGPPVLLVHGFADSAAMWFLSKPDLFRDYHIIATDLPGHGKSEPWRGPRLTIQDMARELDNLVNHLELDQFNLIGHSMGGMVAQQYCVEHPQRVKTLILCSTAVSGSVLVELGFNIQDLKRDIMNRSLKDLLLKDSLSAHEWADVCFARHVDKELVKRYLELESLTDSETAVKCLDAINGWQLDIDRVQFYRGSTIVVFGDEDKLTPANPCMDGLLAAFKQSVARLVTGAGHMLFIEKPDQFEDSVRPYITNK